jgi:DICT domain-containing protein
MLVGSILQKLRDAHPLEQGSNRPLNFGVYFKNTLVALCHALEDSILTADYQPLVMTAFQRGKWYLEEADRYADIAEQSRQILIMAAPDAGFLDHPTSQRANVEVLSLRPDDPVAQEWHLLILSPRYMAMVLCQELSEADYATGIPNQDLERKFYGLWTFEPGLVQETASLMLDHIGTYNPDLQQQLAVHLEAIVAQSQTETALYGLPTADNLGAIVARVVEYLQTSQSDLLKNGSVYGLPGQQGLDKNLISNELQAFLRIAQLIDQTDLSNPMAAAEVATLAETLGQLVDLPAWQLHRLRLAGLLHRIALLPQMQTDLTPGTTPRYAETPSLPLTCPLIPGTQMLRRMQRMKAIATILTHQTEWWDGSGQPAGLAGDEIPVESRILGLVATFQQELCRHRSQHASLEQTTDTPEAIAQSVSVIQAQQGQRWDPKLVETLTLLANGMKQGLSLPVAIPKIASGLWLLDSHSDEELLFSSLQSV